ncbi:contractile injection system tape measure protein [Chitinophaga pinensis]|uniref:Uncharacterized protein n=1 Tax=Chitinophaga pinensis (strain ATCC 43595 / DSM 2588 / LMG 13176 / NBRC 15968 / NCIMB 11800 / UQM 2034) TaxID=485918 RepID=A0A979G5S9_CHIPD|nr:contractile injection system tape measure protein [Chitinophaga pinensis]ACU61395.1 hypothetical protein Cpin_3933 [Chitinophaga pinensis DSM 2588]
MSDAGHIIRRWTFDIQYADKDSAKGLQDKVSSLFNLHLSAAAEKVINEVLSPGESVWVHQLELDLGILPYSNFEQDLLRILPEALEKALRERIAQSGQYDGTAGRPLYFRTEQERHYALLAHYLLSGSMPWWSTLEESNTLEAIVLQLIAASHSQFATFIVQVAQQEYVLRRIAWHFSKQTVQQIITSLEEEQATFILGYITGVITLHQKQALVAHAQNEFERAVWLFVLTYLVTDNSGQFNRKQFIRRHLERLARHFNADYIHLLYIFRKAIDLYRQYIPSDSFVTFIQVLYEENAALGIHPENAQDFAVLPFNGNENVNVPRLLPLRGVPHTDVPLPLLWINYDTIPIREDREEVWQQAVNLFRSFIVGQPLPVWFSRLQKGRQDILLKQAVILLFRKRPMLLADLLDQKPPVIQARLHVHQLFDKPVTPLEENIRHQLQRYAEQDTIQFLQQALPHTFIQHRDSFREIWLQYKQRSHSERLSFYRSVLSPVAVLQQVAIHTTEDDFWTMMRDAMPLLWGNHTIVALQQWQQLLETLVSDNLERERVKLLFRRFNLLWLSGRIQINNSESYINQLAQFLTGYGETTVQKLLQHIVQYDMASVTSLTQIRSALPVLQQVTAALIKAEKQPVVPAPEETTRPAVVSPEKALSPTAPQPYESLFGRPLEPAASEREAITVQNAGLVLLHPFFSTYFSRLELLTKGKFNDEKARQKAIRLLQLLVDGQTGHAEHSLMLNRVLCEAPWEQPLDPDIEISDADKQMAQGLLGAAMQQWSKMKNSSVEGFQASFLQREGQLWQTDEAWILRVKQRSYDIILQTLPWSYGQMRFSWLSKPLYTEWTLT